LKLAIKSIRNSRSTRGVHDITIKTKTKEGFEIDKIDGVGFSASDPAKLPASAVIAILGNPQVSSFSDLKLRVSHTIPVSSGTIIRVTVPQQIRLTNPQQTQTYLKKVERQGRNRANLKFEL